MAGAYCRFCGHRCFVLRQIIVAGELIFSGHLATCYEGKAHDRKVAGMDADTAHNPVREGCECPHVCGPKAPATVTKECY